MPPPESTDSRSSVEIAENTKGRPVVKVKVYREPGDEEAAKDKAMEMYASLTEELEKRGFYGAE